MLAELTTEHSGTKRVGQFAMPLAQVLVECRARTVLRFARMAASIRGSAVVAPADFHAARIALFGAFVTNRDGRADAQPMQFWHHAHGDSAKKKQPATAAAAATARTEDESKSGDDIGDQDLVPGSRATLDARQTALLLDAAKCGNLMALRAALDRGVSAHLGSFDDAGETMLHGAAEKGRLGAAKLLLERKANVNQPDRNGRRPLHLACQGGHVAVARLLIESKANLNVLTEFGLTALMKASRRGKTSCVRLLLERKADASIELALEHARFHRDNTRTALQMAESRGHEKIAAMLRQQHAASADKAAP